jgi:hypothetical protein
MVTKGELVVRTTSFPHLLHRLEAECQDEPLLCRVAVTASAPEEGRVDLMVRNGRTTLTYYQRTPEPVMNIRIRLMGPDDGVLDLARIDPPAGDERSGE